MIQSRKKAESYAKIAADSSKTDMRELSRMQCNIIEVKHLRRLKNIISDIEAC